MSGWKARIGYLSPSVFETPSDWDLILPQGFTIVASGLNVRLTLKPNSTKRSMHSAPAWVSSPPRSAMRFSWAVSLWAPQRGYAVEQEVVAKLSGQVGLPVSTAMSATVAALKFLKVRSTVIATAYKGKH